MYIFRISYLLRVLFICTMGYLESSNLFVSVDYFTFIDNSFAVQYLFDVFISDIYLYHLFVAYKIQLRKMKHSVTEFPALFYTTCHVRNAPSCVIPAYLPFSAECARRSYRRERVIFYIFILRQFSVRAIPPISVGASADRTFSPA